MTPVEQPPGNASRKISRTWRVLGLIIACVATQTACHVDGSGPAQTDPDDRLGTRVSAGGESVPSARERRGRPTWTLDGSEILYPSRASSQDPSAGATVRAAEPDGTNRRVVVTRASSFALSADSRYVYYLNNPDVASPRTLYRVLRAGGSPEQVLVADSLAGVVFSPGDRYVLYEKWGNEPDPPVWSVVWLYDRQLRTHRYVFEGTPLTRSPDGAQILYRHAPATYAITDLDEGTTRPADLGLPDQRYRRLAFRWDDPGIHVLLQDDDAGSLYTFDVASGTISRFYRLHFGGRVLPEIVYPPVWAEDGTRVAFTVDRCLKNPVSCELWNSALYVVDVATGRETLVAETTDPSWIREPVLAPDGDMVLYLVRSELFVSPVP